MNGLLNLAHAMGSLVIDYASVDANNPPDFEALYGSGVRVVAIRKSYCYWDTGHRAWVLAFDHTYERDAARARAAGLVVIAYYFAVFAAGAPSPAEQFANFLAAPGDIIPGVDLPPCVDVEWGSGGFASLHQTPAAVLKLILEHADLLRQKFGRTAGDKKVGGGTIYTAQNEWYDLGSPAAPELADMDLWVKTAYVNHPNTQLDTSVVPRLPHEAYDPHDDIGYYQVPRPWAGVSWAMQQTHGDTLGVVSHTCDMGRYHVLKPGDQGPRVAEFQRRLAHLGAPAAGPLNVTGVYDADTEQAVRALQKARGLTEDGVAGAHAQAAASWGPAA